MISCRKCGIPILDGRTEDMCDECTEWLKNPDELSRKTHLLGIPFKDLGHQDENDRIVTIVKYLQENPGKSVAVLLENGPAYQGKGDRYLEKIRRLLPTVILNKRVNGPVRGCETLQFIWNR